MVFRVLDASAFYSGFPFKSAEKCYTTSLVFEEIKHIKKDHDALVTLLDTNRLVIKDPDKEIIENVTIKAKESGDFSQLSKEDISILALVKSLKGELVTDDFAISNVAKNIGIKVSSIMTSGIKDVGRWIHYCPGCKKNFSDISECPLCGNKLKRKLLKS